MEQMKRLYLSLVFLICILIPLSAQKRQVKIAYYPVKGFQDYDNQSGLYSGYCYEYLLAIRQYADWDYAFLRVDSKDEALKLVEEGGADLIAGVSRSYQAGGQLSFSVRGIINSSMRLVANPVKSRFAYGDYKGFYGMRIGVSSDRDDFMELVRNLRVFSSDHNFFPEIVSFPSDKECEASLISGDIDAILKDSIEKTNFYAIADYQFDDLYFAVNKDKTEILDELNNAIIEIDRIIPTYRSDLERRYYYASELRASFNPSFNESVFLSKRNVVNVGCTKTWFPLGYFEGDRFCGPLADIYYLISQETGLRFKYIAYETYTDVLAAFSRGEVDVLCELPFDFRYAERYRASLSREMASMSVIEVRRLSGLEQDEEPKEKRRLVCSELPGTYTGELVRMSLGDSCDYKTCMTVKACIDSVESGEADMTFLTSYQVAAYQANPKYNTLSYTVMPELQYSICIGVRNACDPRLLSIISKGLTIIGQDRANEIFRSSVQEAYGVSLLTYIYRSPFLFGGIIIFFAVLLVIIPMSIIYFKSLNRKNKDLRRANNAKTEFVSKMSHDIRTPLNGILGMTYLAKAETNPPKTGEYLDKIDLSGHFLLSLVNDILDMNKIVGKNFELHPEPYPFEEFKSYIVAIIAPLCLKKGIACIIDNLELEGAFLVDRLRFNQVFVNILSNSVKYTKSGGHVHLCFANVAADDKTFIGEIIVEDNGIGMSDEFQKKMFEPFTQEKETMANMGSGLGLFIVKQLVESMGGSIRVESKPRRGSRFIVSLSLELVPYEKEKVIVQDDKNLLDGLRVLMCEDNEINAEIASQMLERKGVTVDVAENGKVGLEKFSNSEDGYYDLILMDIRMPVMDGFETAKKIQQLDRSDAKEIPIIALTADAYLQDEEKSTSCGMVAHIAKPVNADCLYETIERCIRARDKVRSSRV